MDSPVSHTFDQLVTLVRDRGDWSKYVKDLFE